MRISSALLIKNCKCVQSYGWQNIRPLGSIQTAIDSLEQYVVDEISIIRIIKSQDDFKAYLNDLDIIRSVKTMTPISFGGGIRTLRHVEFLKNLPIERLIFSSEFIDTNKKLITECINLFGSQAIQCLLPFKINNGQILIYNSKKNIFLKMEELNISFINHYSNEIILYDIENEGKENLFSQSIINEINFDNSKLIISGGIGLETITWAKRNGLASVLIDNKVLHKEYYIKQFKKYV